MKKKETYAAIVLSAGSGKRMQSDIPKQYMDLNGMPVICYSLRAFAESEVDEIVLVCGREDVDFCKKEIVEKYKIPKVKAVVAGGKERYDSVYQGLLQIEDADYVLVHDGARPMVDREMIHRAMEEVKDAKACVIGMPSKDTIKVSDADGYVSHTPDRNRLWMIQTPQAFCCGLLKASYEKVFADREAKIGAEINITDDAMVWEYAQPQKVKLVTGSYENIKITTPEDIAVASLFLAKRNS